MTKNTKACFALVAGGLLSLATAQAQDVKMQFHLTGEDTPWEVSLSEVRKLTFGDADMTLIGKDDASLKVFQLANLKKLTFSDPAAGINGVEATPTAVSFSRMGDFIQVKGASSLAAAKLYSATGQRVGLSIAGDQLLDVKQLPAGVYLLQVGGQTYKFSK